MTTLIICLFIATLLPFLAKIPVAIAMHKLGGYNNKHPRSQQSELTGFGARALAGHQNAFESVIIFAPAIILAITTNHTGNTMEQLAIAHVAARIIYHICYLVNLDIIRSVVWGIAMVCSFSLIYLCI